MGTLLLTTKQRRYHLFVVMAAILAGNNVEEEFLWSCTLNSETKEYVWDPKEPEDYKGVKPSHRLLIKTAVLMPEAKQDEVTIVQIESEGYNKKQVVMPIVAMKGGSDMQKYVDLLVPAFPATLKIIEGSGPLHLVGSHCVDYYSGKDDEEASDDETADEEMEQEESDDKGDKKASPEKVSPGKEKKTSPAKEKEGEKKASPAKE